MVEFNYAWEGGADKGSIVKYNGNLEMIYVFAPS